MSDRLDLSRPAAVPDGHPDRAAVHQMLGTAPRAVTLALPSRSDVLALVAGVHDDLLVDDVDAMVARLRAHRRRDRWQTLGGALIWALMLAACLIFWGALIDELLIHLGK